MKRLATVLAAFLLVSLLSLAPPVGASPKVAMIQVKGMVCQA